MLRAAANAGSPFILISFNLPAVLKRAAAGRFFNSKECTLLIFLFIRAILVAGDHSSNGAYDITCVEMY